ncbi:MAG TPA: hypothetical protein VHJ17_13495 [Thermomonospora sp.]|nr:hypothetical protein [Thermomonospora sp.]
MATPRCWWHQCGRPVPVLARRGQRYCSAACRAAHWRWAHVLVPRAVTEAKALLTGTDPRCPVCGGLVRTARRRADAVYCSAACRTRAWRSRRDGSANAVTTGRTRIRL